MGPPRSEAGPASGHWGVGGTLSSTRAFMLASSCHVGQWCDVRHVGLKKAVGALCPLIRIGCPCRFQSLCHVMVLVSFVWL